VGRNDSFKYVARTTLIDGVNKSKMFYKG